MNVRNYGENRMLSHLRIRNFKNWSDTGPIQLAPLTVFFGTNSSGKSSLGQFLLLLRQTVDSSDRKQVLFPGDANSPVNLGSFEEFIFGRNAALRLEFELQWSLREPLRVQDARSSFSAQGDEIRFEAVVGRPAEKPGPIAVDRLVYNLIEASSTRLTVGLQPAPAFSNEYKLVAEPLNIIRNQGRAWPLTNPIKFYGFPDQILAYYQNADFVQDFSLEMERLLRSLSYLGPLRSRGQRLYYWTGGEPESVGYSGEHSISALLAAKERNISAGQKRKGRRFQELIAEKLKQLELIERFEVKQISANRKEYEVKVKTPGSPALVDLPDVGFGISQVLPVIVQCYYAPPGSIIFIEQPELHLHPKAQAHLADVLIDALSSREGGKDRGIQLIIETHSEHFLHRLQRRIAEDSKDHPIEASEVQAYFASTSGKGSKLERLEIDEFGNIGNWPEDFFGDPVSDLFERANAEGERKDRQQSST